MPDTVLRETRLLIEAVARLRLQTGTKRSLLAKLEAAAQAFQRGNQTAGGNQLNAFANELRAQSEKNIPVADAMRLIAGAEDLRSCL